MVVRTQCCNFLLSREFRGEGPLGIRLGRASICPRALDLKNWHRKKEHFESKGSGFLFLGGSRRRASTDPLSPEHSVPAPNVQRRRANSKPSEPSVQTPRNAVYLLAYKSRKEHFENRQIWMFLFPRASRGEG